MIQAAQGTVFLVSPWLKLAGAELILNAIHHNPAREQLEARLLTTANMSDFLGQRAASDLEAYMLLLAQGFDIRVVRGLHAKVYICDEEHAIITSGNLIAKGLGRARQCNLEAAVYLKSRSSVETLNSRLLSVWQTGTRFTGEHASEVAKEIARVVDRFQSFPAGEEKSDSATSLPNEAPNLFYIPWWEVPERQEQRHPELSGFRLSSVLDKLKSDTHLKQAVITLDSVRTAMADNRTNSRISSTQRPFSSRHYEFTELGQANAISVPDSEREGDRVPDDRGTEAKITPVDRDEFDFSSMDFDYSEDEEGFDFVAMAVANMRAFLAQPFKASKEGKLSPSRPVGYLLAPDRWEPDTEGRFPHPLGHFLADLDAAISADRASVLGRYGSLRPVFLALTPRSRLHFYEVILRLRSPGLALAILHEQNLLASINLEFVEEQLVADEAGSVADPRGRRTTVALDNAPNSAVVRWAILLYCKGGKKAGKFLRRLGTDGNKAELVSSLIRSHQFVRDLFLSDQDDEPLDRLPRLIDVVGDQGIFHIGMADAFFGETLRKWEADTRTVIQTECAHLWEERWRACHQQDTDKVD
jgi:hypothetical protein